MEAVTLSQLKGLEIHYPDDFYEFAEFLFRLYQSKGELRNEEGITRPTIYGLARAFPVSVSAGPSGKRMVWVVRGLDGWERRSKLIPRYRRVQS